MTATNEHDPNHRSTLFLLDTSPKAQDVIDAAREWGFRNVMLADWLWLAGQGADLRVGQLFGGLTYRLGHYVYRSQQAGLTVIAHVQAQGRDVQALTNLYSGAYFDGIYFDGADGTDNAAEVAHSRAILTALREAGATPTIPQHAPTIVQHALPPSFFPEVTRSGQDDWWWRSPDVRDELRDRMAIHEYEQARAGRRYPLDLGWFTDLVPATDQVLSLSPIVFDQVWIAALRNNASVTYRTTLDQLRNQPYARAKAAIVSRLEQLRLREVATIVTAPESPWPPWGWMYNARPGPPDVVSCTAVPHLPGGLEAFMSQPLVGPYYIVSLSAPSACRVHVNLPIAAAWNSNEWGRKQTMQRQRGARELEVNERVWLDVPATLGAARIRDALRGVTILSTEN